MPQRIPVYVAALILGVPAWVTTAQDAGTCPCAGNGPASTAILIDRCDPSNTTFCELHCSTMHGSETYLADKCCVHAGKAASLLAFEEDAKWVDRLEEFNKCTGANVRLEYLPEGEDGMADALVRDVGDDTSLGNTGEGIFDAYIVQAPWLPPVVEGLENLSPLIKESADVVKFLDINPASRAAVSFNGTVRALPLDTDYVAIAWRQDVFFKHGIDPKPPQTIEELAELSEQLNGLDHNDDGEPDWGVCLTPQVNYFYAFVAPVLQTQLIDTQTGIKTGQNIFFDSETFEPLIRVPGFRYALEQYWRVIRSSNCQGQLANGEKCNRLTAFPTGRCAMVISMPGTLTSMLLETGSRAPQDRLGLNDTVEWSIHDQPIGPGGTYWGRRAPFPGSKFVQSWDRKDDHSLVPCVGAACPHADADGVNFAPFFAEGGEAYALNGRQSKPASRDVMWDVFKWLSELPVTKLPLSGQYRKSHLNDESRVQLINDGWSQQMVDDLYALLGEYFKGEDENGNAVQDLLMLGFPEYMSALDEELHDKLFGIKVSSEGGLFDKENPENSIHPMFDEEVFDVACDRFLDTLEARFRAISKAITGGPLAQLQRWRQSLDLPWRTDDELCSKALSISPASFVELECARVVDMETLCLTQSEDVARVDVDLCDQYFGKENQNMIIIASSVLSAVLLVVLAVYAYFQRQKRNADALWALKTADLIFQDPPQVVGRGAFGLVLLAEYRGTKVAVKQVLPPQSGGSTIIGPPVYYPQDHQEVAGNSWGGLNFSDGFGLNPNVPLSKKSPSSASSPEQFSSRIKKDDYAKLKSDFIEEMRLLSKLRHPCITTVMGAVINSERPTLVMEYMELGSLYEVLHNKTIALDGDMVLPILQEIAQGLRFLHGAEPPIIHGDLKAKNILVDSKFRAKVADFGLSQKKKRGVTGTPFWMAPELLRGQAECNTMSSDVYSFGVILYEVYARKEPYEGENEAQVLRNLLDRSLVMRPAVPADCPKKIRELMDESLDSDPKARPSFEEIDLKLQRMSVENIEPGEMNLSHLQRKNLKASRANSLLQNVFPPHIAEALVAGRKVEQESHECVTLFFSDIVNFTSISERLTPQQVCSLLDRLYLRFDQLVGTYDVFKIETIGDAYMASTNLVKDQSSDHVKRCALFAIDAVRAASEILIDTNDPSLGCVQIRAGFHTGPVISDVVGSRLPKYGVFGDTVNVAARMESNSSPGQIQCSKASADLLIKQAPEVALTPRGEIRLKGKSAGFETFWVSLC